MNTILNTITLYQDRFFTIKSDEVQLENGTVGKFEYADSFDDRGAVMVVPVNDDGDYYFVQMFKVGTGQQTITFSKGGSKQGYTAILSVQEEIGMKSENLQQIGTLYSHPGRSKREHNIILAQGLSQSKLQGDEIETITILKLSRNQVKAKIMSGAINDAKTIASYYMSLEYSNQHY